VQGPETIANDVSEKFGGELRGVLRRFQREDDTIGVDV
jgi:hypothetical protein